MGALQRGVDRVAAVGRIVVADRTTRLHARGSDAVDHEAMLDDVIGPGEGGVGRGLVAEELHEADIVGALLPDPGRALGGGLRGRHDRGKRLVIDHDQFGRVLGLNERLRHDEGDVVTGPAHVIFDKGGIGRAKAAAVAALEPIGDRQVPPSRGLPVRSGEHREHARRPLRPACIDRANARMGVRRAQHVAERHARQHDIAHIAAPAPEEARILELGHALADREFTHLASSEVSKGLAAYRKAAACWLPASRAGCSAHPKRCVLRTAAVAAIANGPNTCARPHAARLDASPAQARRWSSCTFCSCRLRSVFLVTVGKASPIRM